MERRARRAVTRRGWALLLLAGATLVTPRALDAQLPTLPIVPDPFRTNVDFGPDNEIRVVVGGRALGDGAEVGLPWALAARRRVHESVTLHVAGGTWRSPGPAGETATKPQLGVAGDLVVLDEAWLVVSAHAGVGYLAAVDGRVLDVPLGVGVTVEVASVASLLPFMTPSPGGPAVYLWGLPRVEVLDRSRGDASETESLAAISLGIGVAGSESLGIHLGLDARTRPAADGILPRVPTRTWGVAVRYRI